MKKISLALVALGLSTAPLLVNAMGSSDAQDGSYEAGKRVGEAIDTTKVKTTEAWQATKVNTKEAVAYAKDKSDEVASSASQAVDSFSEGVKDGSK